MSTGTSAIGWSVIPVADADAMLQDLAHTARHGTTGHLGALAMFGRLIMSKQAITEVDTHLDRVARNNERGVTMREAWQRYQPSIKVVDESTCDLTGAQVDELAARDPRDLHLLAAASAHPSSIILSNDTDLTDLELAPPCWLEAARAVIAIHHGDANRRVLAWGVEAAFIAVPALIESASSGSWPAIATLTLMAIAAVYVLADDERRGQLLAMLGTGVDHLAAVELGRVIALAQIAAFVDPVAPPAN